MLDSPVLHKNVLVKVEVKCPHEKESTIKLKYFNWEIKKIYRPFSIKEIV